MNEYKYSIASRMDIFYKCEQSFMLEQCSLTYNIHPSKRDIYVKHTTKTIKNKHEKLERKGEASFDTPFMIRTKYSKSLLHTISKDCLISTDTISY